MGRNIEKIISLLVLSFAVGGSACASFAAPKNSVVTNSIVNGAVTHAKQGALGQQVSSSSNGFFTANSSYTDVTNLTVTITTFGRPVFLGLISDGSSNGSLIGCDINSGTACVARGNFVRAASTEIGDFGFEVAPASSGNVIYYMGSFPWTVDTVAAGTYTYKVQVKVIGSTSHVDVWYMKLVAFEL